MGAKKDKDKEVLRRKRDKYRELANAYETLGISQKKIDNLKVKENKYAAWVITVETSPDY